MQDTPSRRAAAQVSGLVFVACILFAGAGEATGRVSLNFDTYLAEGYRQIAGAAVRVGAQASLLSSYKKRSADAADGQAIVPQEPDADALDPRTLREANSAREELVESLQSSSSQHQPGSVSAVDSASVGSVATEMATVRAMATVSSEAAPSLGAIPDHSRRYETST